MNFKATINKSNNNLYQQYIDDYVKDFKRRSQGYDLPEIEFYGEIINGIPLKIENESRAKFFVAIPIKNQEKIICNVLEHLFNNSKQVLQVGLLFDACEDKSFEICEKYLMEYINTYPNIERIYIIKSKGDLFESTCENILNIFCKQEFFVSLQADVFFTDNTFFDRAVNYFTKQPELFGVSGRAIVPFRISNRNIEIFTKILNLINPRYLQSKFFKNYKKLGFYIRGMTYFGDKSFMPDQPMKFTSIEFNKIYLGDAIIRGPIIWRNKMFNHLDRYNDVAFFLGRDDCDICFRGKKYGFQVGYIPTLSYSIPENGTTRNSRSALAQKFYLDRNVLSKNNPGDLHLFWEMKRISF